jgi:UPF0716 family protein affecting phage T7 exclusion
MEKHLTKRTITIGFVAAVLLFILSAIIAFVLLNNQHIANKKL